MWCNVRQCVCCATAIYTNFIATTDIVKHLFKKSFLHSSNISFLLFLPASHKYRRHVATDEVSEKCMKILLFSGKEWDDSQRQICWTSVCCNPARTTKEKARYLVWKQHVVETVWVTFCLQHNNRIPSLSPLGETARHTVGIVARFTTIPAETITFIWTLSFTIKCCPISLFCPWPVWILYEKPNDILKYSSCRHTSGIHFLICPAVLLKKPAVILICGQNGWISTTVFLLKPIRQNSSTTAS